MVSGGWCYREVLPFIAMVSVICTTVGLNTLFKAATLKGLNYSSTILSSALSNLTPAYTFILAVMLRMEKLALRGSTTQAKIMGTIVSISGAIIVVLYKGPTLILTSSSSSSISLHQPLGSSESNWFIGSLLLAASYLMLSIVYIVQAQILKVYSNEMHVVFLYDLGATIISVPVCLIAERNLSAWRIRPDIALVTIVYSGFLVSSFNAVVYTWCLRLKGPVYISIFQPLSIAIAAIMGVIFLGDSLYLGSVVGGIIISIGFFAVIWGKAKEMGEDYAEVPLLQSHEIEET